MERLRGAGIITAEQWRKGRCIKWTKGHNDFTYGGMNHMLDCVFGISGTVPETQYDPWYIGLINNTPTPTLLIGDTLASHSGWSEIPVTTGYTGNRKEWNDEDAADGVKTITTVSTFALLVAYVVYGIFVCSAASGTSGILWSTGAFDDPISLAIGDDLKVTYELTLSS